MNNHFYDQTFGRHADSDRIFLHTEDGDIRFDAFAAQEEIKEAKKKSWFGR